METFVYTLIIYGITNILVFFSGPFNILDRFRNFMSKIHPTFTDLFSCMCCLGTWIGLIASILNITLCPDIAITAGYRVFGEVDFWPLILIADMFYASGIVWLIHTLQEMCDRIARDPEEDEDRRQIL